jgi:flagellar basal-body rod modification protein FlgD
MAVAGVSSTIPNYVPPDPFAPVGDKELDRNDFMMLFITQLQYQDPMKPMDSYEMASQLAQFSNMEATMKMSDNMEKLLEYQTSQNNLQLLTLIDKDVQSFGNNIAVVEGEANETDFTLADAADICIVEIYDSAGRMVNSVNLGYKASGDHEFTWDGKNAKGDPVSDGAYTYVVDALSGAGQQIEVDYRTTGHVTGLEFNSGRATVTVDKYITINVSDILKVK